MYNKIITTFEEVSRKHLLIKSFRYGDLSIETSVATDIFPQVILEEGIIIDLDNIDSNASTVSLNFNVLSTVVNDNLNTISQTENLMATIASQLILKIAEDYSWVFKNISIMSIDNYSDNRLYGVRVSMNILLSNFIQFCDNNFNFNDYKLLDDNTLETFATQANNQIFSDNYLW